ncbi:NUDIX domain-containing protein [Sphingomonas sp. KR1UV-12]|uniref:NUDIX domain-containing protein n=1 Tax=Sphingomonas aurea TaxID=3063994 RepID=A0ABT9EKC1_9SPHN|nr:NUDIX domain-containing protein [Sphingomonas sp. KR1UV-12]MDP1027420.1 NUDIX domain-containing protein [Sphingomonas sp. KR1UV-12]
MRAEAIVRLPRPAARILMVDRDDRVLLFRFTPTDRPPLWCTPGGKVDDGESYEDAARRELWEETGLTLDCGAQVARRQVQFVTFEGDHVDADERYFRIDLDACEIAAGALTELERQVLDSWRWFTRAELADWPEQIFPADLNQLLEDTK